MMRVWGPIMTGIAAAALGGTVIFACAHNDSELFVRAVIAPQIVSPGTPCNFTTDPSQETVPSGTFDTALVVQYKAALLVGNQTVAQGNPNTPRTETSIITIQGAVVRVLFGGRQIGTFTADTSGSVSPAVGSTPSYEVVTVPLVDTAMLMGDPTIAGVLSPTSEVHVVAYVRVLGETLGGQSVETREFAFPIDVCFGCLINCPSTTSNAAQSTTGSCSGEDFRTSFDFTSCSAIDTCRQVCFGGTDAGTSSATDAGAAGD